MATSDSGGSRDLGSIFYPKSEPLQAGSAANPPPDRPTTLAEVFGYGGPRDPNLANPMGTPAPEPRQYRGEAVDRLPQGAASEYVAPEPREPTASLGEILYGKRKPEIVAQNDVDPSPADATPAAETEPQPDSAAADAELMNQFNNISDELGIGEGQERERLLTLHEQAIAAMRAHEATEWRRQSESMYSARDLADVRTRLDAALGNDKVAADFKSWLAQGPGNHPAAIAGIRRLLGRR